LGVVDAKSANVESYVTEQALNGLFEMIGKQEETIRKNPALRRPAWRRKCLAHCNFCRCTQKPAEPVKVSGLFVACQPCGST
jgi:hypothetical protein